MAGAAVSTSHKVQGLVPGNARSTDDTGYEPVTCTACTGMHFVNPRSGRVLGVNSTPDASR